MRLATTNPVWLWRHYKALRLLERLSLEASHISLIAHVTDPNHEELGAGVRNLYVEDLHARASWATTAISAAKYGELDGDIYGYRAAMARALKEPSEEDLQERVASHRKVREVEREAARVKLALALENARLEGEIAARKECLAMLEEAMK